MSRAKRIILAALRHLLARQNSQPYIEPELTLTLVALALDEPDQALLKRLAAENGWRIYFAGSPAEAWQIVNDRKAQIVLCEREEEGTDWREVIRKMVSASHPVCAILISNVTDDYLWNEVIMWGGHDVLAAPLREEHALRAIRLAWLYWSSAVKGHAGAA